MKQTVDLPFYCTPPDPQALDIGCKPVTHFLVSSVTLELGITQVGRFSYMVGGTSFLILLKRMKSSMFQHRTVSPVNISYKFQEQLFVALQ